MRKCGTQNHDAETRSAEARCGSARHGCMVRMEHGCPTQWLMHNVRPADCQSCCKWAAREEFSLLISSTLFPSSRHGSGERMVGDAPTAHFVLLVDIDFTNTAVDEAAEDSSDVDDGDDLEEGESSDGEKDMGFSVGDEWSEDDSNETDGENEVSTSGYGVEGSDESDELSFEEDDTNDEDDDEEVGENNSLESGQGWSGTWNARVGQWEHPENTRWQAASCSTILMCENPSEPAGDRTQITMDIRNTVGNIPMKWYDEYKHLGYDWDGKKILKPPQGDALDNFLKRMEDPNFWRTVKDPQTGQDVILCDADVDLIQRIQSQKVPDAEFDEYAPWIEWFSSEVMKMPVRKFPEHKRSFLPSRSEKQKVSRIVHAIKMGWIKPREKKVDTGPKFYMLWQSDDSAEQMRRIHNHIPAPKRNLPGHAESYNPPAEYLFDKREVSQSGLLLIVMLNSFFLKQWRKLKATPWKRKLHFIPEKHSCLREVPAYKRYIRERFLRCLDLYLCPRARKMKHMSDEMACCVQLMIEPEDLVPQLPSPQDLQPFPTTQSLVYEGHTDLVRSVTVEPRGQYLASGSDDLTVKIWEVATTRCVRTIAVGGVVRSVSWCPNQALSLIAVAADRKVLLINPHVGDRLVVSKTDTLLRDPPPQDVIGMAGVAGLYLVSMRHGCSFRVEGWPGGFTASVAGRGGLLLTLCLRSSGGAAVGLLVATRLLWRAVAGRRPPLPSLQLLTVRNDLSYLREQTLLDYTFQNMFSYDFTEQVSHYKQKLHATSHSLLRAPGCWSLDYYETFNSLQQPPEAATNKVAVRALQPRYRTLQ
ncbi:hypothetical protein PR048_015293 [Dryococelus australis]|uniref:BOP1 N-terminal domain-containing protein n=1 Tax=Dryococelus australis TaxID=614101 RepID=A0ABQ9HGU0_9NEOP|nr:hypothetical protein PR048_015293 [Dryococelus australis]